MKEAPCTTNQQNPFPGLRPFLETEEHLFFGREKKVDAMVDKLAITRFLAVVGSSGSGKSSLVNCGLCPALYGGSMASARTSWKMVKFRPGNRPLQAMAKALAKDGVLFHNFHSESLTMEEIIDTNLQMSPLGLIDVYEQARLPENTNLLVVVDQFEELFRYRQSGAVAVKQNQNTIENTTAFVNLLLKAAEQREHPIYVVITMRSDFLGDCVQFPGLAESINVGQYLVPRLSRDERRAAIEGPVHVGHATISSVLLTRLINDVGDNPDQLSILQHSLNRTWAYWCHEGNCEGPLDLHHYKEVGTMDSALDQHAEKAYKEVQQLKNLESAHAKYLCKKLFKTITDKATDPRGIRQPTTLRKICSITHSGPGKLSEDEEAEMIANFTKIIEVFRKPSRSFLMPPANEVLGPGSVIDISHESLMRVWQRLDKWANKEAQSAQIYRRLAETALLHRNGKAGLSTDPELQVALDWREQNQPNEEWAERYHSEFTLAMTFLNESHKERERIAQEKLDERERIAQEKLDERERIAQEKRDERERIAQEKRDKKERIANEEKVKRQEELRRSKKLNKIIFVFCALLLSLAVLAGIMANKANEAKLEAESAEKKAVELKKKANMQACVSLLRDKAALAEEFLPIEPDKALLLALHASGKTRDDFGMADPRVESILFQAIQATPWSNLFPTQQENLSMAVSADGETIVTGGFKGTVRLWNSKGELLSPPLLGHGRSVYAVAITPDGKSIVSGSHDGTVQLWNSKGEKVGGPWTHREYDWLSAVAITADGSTIISGSDKGTIKLWDRTGKTTETLIARGQINALVASDDGKTIVAAFDDGSATAWILDTQKLEIPLKVPSKTITSVAITAEGEMILTGAEDGTLARWDRNGNIVGTPMSGHEAEITSVSVTDDGKILASASADGAVRIWDDMGRPLGVPRWYGEGTNSLAIAAQGKILFTGRRDGAVFLSPVDNFLSGRELSKSLGVSTDLQNIAISPDGTRILGGGKQGIIYVWDYNGKLLHLITPKSKDGSPIIALAMSADNKTIASSSAGENPEIRLWDEKGQPVGKPWKMEKNAIAAIAVSANGELIVGGDSGGSVWLWNRSGVLDLKARTDDDILSKSPSQYTYYSIGQRNSITALAITPDNSSIVVGDLSGAVRLWDVKSNTLHAPLHRHFGRVNSVAITPDGRKIASGGNDETIRLWQSGTNQSRSTQSIRGLEAPVTSVAFSADENYIVGGSSRNTVQLWRLTKNRIYKHSKKKHLRSRAGVKLEIQSKGKRTTERVLIAFNSEKNTVVSASPEHLMTWSWPVGDSKNQMRIASNLIRNHAALVDPTYPFGKTYSSDVGDPEWLRSVLDSCLKHGNWSDDQQARHLARRGRVWARMGSKAELAKAIGCFKEALDRASQIDLNPETSGLDQDPEELAQRLAAPVKAQEGITYAKRSGDMEKALAAFKEALRYNPNIDLDLSTPDIRDSNPQEVAKRYVAPAKARIARDFARRGSVEKAISIFKEALELDSQIDLDPYNDDSEQNPEKLAESIAIKYLLRDADRSARKGDTAEAIKGYSKALALNSDIDLNPATEQRESDPKTLANQKYAQTIVRQAHYSVAGTSVEAAEELLLQAQKLDPQVNLDPNSEQPEHNAKKVSHQIAARAKVKAAAKNAADLKLEELKRMLAKALELDPNVDLDPETVGAVERNPADVAPRLINRARSALKYEEAMQLLQKGKWEQALAALKETSSLDPTLISDATYWFELGTIHTLLGNGKAGLEAFDKLVKLAKNDPDELDDLFKFFRAIAMSLTGDTKGALADLNNIEDPSEIEDTFPSFTMWLKDLQQMKQPFTPKVLANLRKQLIDE